jgi:hypothetical protein
VDSCADERAVSVGPSPCIAPFEHLGQADMQLS